MMKMTTMMWLTTSLVFTVLVDDVFAVKSQEDPGDTPPVPPAVKKRKSTQVSTVATNPDLFSPRPKSTPHPKRPRKALQRFVIFSQEDEDENAPPASGSSTCDPIDDQDVTTHEQRVGQILPLLSPEFREPLYRNQIDEFVLELESGRVLQNILTALRRIETENRFYAINWVRTCLNYPRLLDSDEDEIIEVLENYDGSQILVPPTPPETPRR